MEVTIKEGVINSDNGTIGPHQAEGTIHLKHATAGAHSLTVHEDGSYTMLFPSIEHYQDFLDEVMTCSADEAVKADILRRHRDAS